MYSIEQILGRARKDSKPDIKSKTFLRILKLGSVYLIRLKTVYFMTYSKNKKEKF